MVIFQFHKNYLLQNFFYNMLIRCKQQHKFDNRNCFHTILIIPYINPTSGSTMRNPLKCFINSTSRNSKKWFIIFIKIIISYINRETNCSCVTRKMYCKWSWLNIITTSILCKVNIILCRYMLSMVSKQWKKIWNLHSYIILQDCNDIIAYKCTYV